MAKIESSVLDKARMIISSLGCDYAEIRISSSDTTAISLSGERIESVSSGATCGGSVRVLNEGSWGFISFNNLDELDTFAKRALYLSSKVRSSVKSGVVKSEPVKMEAKSSFVKDFTKVSLDEKFRLIDSYNSILRSDRRIQTTSSLYRDSSAQIFFANSGGSEFLYDRYHCGAALTAVARDGSEIQPFHDSFAGYGGYELVENKSDVAERIARTAVDLLTAESVRGGTYDVILDPRLAGVFIHEAFGHLSEADFLYENETMKKIMVLGKDLGPRFLNVIDDGTMKEGGYIPLDDEGVLPSKTYLIKDGILSGRLHSRETAYKMNEKPTGNARAISSMSEPLVRMTNTYIENGPHKRDEIFESVDDGLYAVNYHGGQTNLEMFTFSSAYGFEIKKGKRGKMLKNITLSGNVFETLKNIAMIGDDRVMFGGLGGCGKGGQYPLPVSLGGPHILVKDVLVGGSHA